MRKTGVAVLFTALTALSFGLSTAPSASAADAKLAAVKGQVVIDGKAPAPTELKITADQKFCSSKGPILSETWVVNPKTKGVKNVLIWIGPDSDKAGTPFPADKIPANLKQPKDKEVVIDQPCCSFVPHVAIARKGQTLVIKNSAAVPHNAKWSSGENGEQNPLIPPGGKIEIKDLKAERLPASLGCTIHPWMNAKLMVVDTPYYAVTDADGKFEIKDLPAGTYRLFVWHEGIGWLGGREGRNGKKITVAPSGTDLGKISIKPKSSS